MPTALRGHVRLKLGALCKSPAAVKTSLASLYTTPMAKYDPLRNHLSLSGQLRLTMTFDQIAALVGTLPRSAWDHRAWWSNHAATHTHAEAWISASYRVESVDQSLGLATFIRDR